MSLFKQTLFFSSIHNTKDSDWQNILKRHNKMKQKGESLMMTTFKDQQWLLDNVEFSSC